MPASPESTAEQLQRLFSVSGVEDTRPTYQKDAVDDEFHQSSGNSLPKFNPGRLKSILCGSTGSFQTLDGIPLTISQVC